jgi:hypothetical protein
VGCTVAFISLAFTVKTELLCPDADEASKTAIAMVIFLILRDCFQRLK